MGKVIRISESVFTQLQNMAEPFTDTPASVIERLIDFYEQHYNTSQSVKITKNDTGVRTFNIDNPPDLRYTKIDRVILENQVFDKINWNQLVQEVHCLAHKKAKTFDALQLITNFHIKPGYFTDHGFRYIKKINISLQNVDANKAFSGILKIVEKLDTSIEVYFQWENRPDLEHSGKKGLLKL